MTFQLPPVDTSLRERLADGILSSMTIAAGHVDSSEHSVPVLVVEPFETGRHGGSLSSPYRGNALGRRSAYMVSGGHGAKLVAVASTAAGFSSRNLGNRP